MRCLPLVVGRDDVGCFAKGVLAGINSSYTDVEGGTTIAAGDNHWFSEMLAQGFEDGLAALQREGICGSPFLMKTGPDRGERNR